MPTFHLDTERGDDADDGTTEALAKKTATAVLSVSANGDTIIVYPGEYPKSDGAFTFSRIWQGKFRNTVLVTLDSAGPYITVTPSNEPSVTYEKITFKDFTDEIVDNTNTNGADVFKLIATDCRFQGAGRIIKKSSNGQNAVLFTRCVFDDCGNSLPLFDSLQPPDTIFDSCVFYNINCGGSNLINITSSFDFIKNNIFQLITAARIYNFPFTDVSGKFSDMDFNTYFESSFTLSVGFCVTGTGEKALFSNLQADTTADPSGLITDPQFVDPLKGMFVAQAGGNSDATGVGGSFRGALGIGFGMSTNINGATEWDNFTIVPAGEIVLNGGNWEHIGTDSTVATAESTIKDLGSIRVIKELRLIHENDPPEGIVDTTLADGKRTLEWKFTDALPITMAYVEVNRGDNTLNTSMRFVQFRVTERNDG